MPQERNCCADPQGAFSRCHPALPLHTPPPLANDASSGSALRDRAPHFDEPSADEERGQAALGKQRQQPLGHDRRIYMREGPHPGPSGSQAPKGASAPAGSCPANSAGHSVPAGAAEPEDSDAGVRDLEASPTETHKRRESLSGSSRGQVARCPKSGTAAQIRRERIPETRRFALPPLHTLGQGSPPWSGSKVVTPRAAKVAKDAP
ncbi:hypothetical protein BDD21_5415 [Thiocapsa rosea]|uniref:Uncharacterized protein n=1 Tax=Thiocapsa rosea TaxID=69360 RepID=A0A495UKU2_9GAMM|nr:hypothetical protein BDD21_5415 [Thiocapsa rosea]